ncbi:MAG: hypothetical protein M3Y54_19205 [Bacteroidota bacterium]|nr:hypothetical protein [Bacteroidota bacterium]
MRFIGFIGGLLLAALPLPGTAQTAPPPRPVLDSAAAVQRLFKQHRRSAETDLAFGAVGLVGLVYGATHSQPALLGPNALIGLVSTALGLRQTFRYGEGRESFILRQYEQGWPLPADVRRRLRPKYFRAKK